MDLFVDSGILVFEIDGVEIEEPDLSDFQFVNCIRAIINLDPLEERGRGGARNGFKPSYEIESNSQSKLDNLSERIVDYLNSNPCSSRSDIANGLNIQPDQNLTNTLCKLKTKSKIFSKGERKGAKWSVGISS
jgi:hypothetical protein